MGEALFELEQILSSNQVEPLTPQEANVLLTCKSRAVRAFMGGALVGSGVVWAGTWRLSKLLRINLTGGAAAICGLWRLGRSLHSCLDHILALDGSRMQMELATVMLKKYQGDPWRMQLISKHFYPEKVYDDSTLDQPKLKWCYRTFYSDNVAYGHRTRDNDSHKDSHNDSENNFKNDSHNGSNSEKTDLESKQVLVNSGIDVMADPLDSIFGYMTTVEDIQHPNASSMPTRVPTRSHKRSHRRRRMRQQEASLDSQHS